MLDAIIECLGTTGLIIGVFVLAGITGEVFDRIRKSCHRAGTRKAAKKQLYISDYREII